MNSLFKRRVLSPNCKRILKILKMVKSKTTNSQTKGQINKKTFTSQIIFNRSILILMDKALIQMTTNKEISKNMKQITREYPEAIKFFPMNIKATQISSFIRQKSCFNTMR